MKGKAHPTGIEMQTSPSSFQVSKTLTGLFLLVCFYLGFVCLGFAVFCVLLLLFFVVV